MAQIRQKMNFDQVGIGTVLARHLVQVPLYQREYCWEDKEVTALFHDLSNAYDSENASYFLGTVVVILRDDETLEVIDGQQRLATVSMLLAAIRDYFHTVRHDDLLVRSLEEFLFKIVRKTREISPRLVLNSADKDYFIRRILERPESKRRTTAVATAPSHHRIARAAELAAQHVLAIVGQHAEKNRSEALDGWVHYLETSAEVILAKCPDEENAFLMFETINDRGAELSQADLLKNYLFSQTPTKIHDAFDKWEKMKGTLELLGDDQKLMLTYLRHETISVYGYTIEREVFHTLRAKIRGKLPASEFLDKLADDAQNYVAIHTPSHAKWNEYPPSIRECVRTLSILPVTPLRPLMLSVARRFGAKQADLVFRNFVSWSVRLLIAGGARSGGVEQAIAEQAKEVSDGRVDTAAKLTQALRDVIPADAEFEGAFAIARVSSGALARYYLRSLELRRKGHPEPEWIPNEDTVINLEHIYPQNPDAAVSWTEFDTDIGPAYCRRLGNLVLLQASKNSDIGNADFKSKKATLAGSSYYLTAEVAENKTWSPKAIEARQHRLAKLAVKTWPLK